MNKIKPRLLPSLLCGFAFAFTYFFFGAIDIYAGNRAEFLFSFSDFVWILLLMVSGIWMVVTVTLLFIPKKAYAIVYGIFVWLTVMAYIQAAFLSFGTSMLVGDNGKVDINIPFAILDLFIWLATGAGSVIGALKMQKFPLIKTVSIILLVVIGGMQLVGCVSQLPAAVSTETSRFDTTETEADTESTAESTTSDGTSEEITTENAEINSGEDEFIYLSTEGMNHVGAKKNIVVFVLDRFDVEYYDRVKSENPGFFDKLTGFTYFEDNVSLYSRTYPAITSMISGMENDFSGKAQDYFNKAYSNSQFLKDLKSNNYSVRIYTADYYAYRDASPLTGIADNLSGASGYTVTNKGSLAGYMLGLSLYRCLPNFFKPCITISTASFDKLTDYNGDYPEYILEDATTYATLAKGLDTDNGKYDNAYTFFHLNGCHVPYEMDENGNAVTGGNVVSSTMGCFKLIYNYIDELKRLGVYQDSTIVITGDHSNPINDYLEPSEPRMTALFVKEAGKSDEALSYSKAQVSQANLIPTLVKSAGLKTSNQYDKSYFEIPEGFDNERHHLFQLAKGSNNSSEVYIYDYKITGNGRDFDSWRLDKTFFVGYLYK